MNDSQIVEDLAFLRRVVEDSRRMVVNNGINMLSWGVLIVVGAILTYAAGHFKIALPTFWIWIVLIAIGWTLSIWDGWLKRRRARTRTFIQRVLGSLWIGLGIVMTIIGFLAPVSGAITPWATVPLISLILGAGFLASGTIHQERLLTAAAFGWWIGGTITLLVPGDYSILLFAGMMILFQIAPGLVVYSRWKKEMGSAG